MPILLLNFLLFVIGKEWLNLNQLANVTGHTVLFDLNALIRNDDGSWQSKNAEELVDFSDKHNLSVLWELGNGKAKVEI